MQGGTCTIGAITSATLPNISDAAQTPTAALAKARGNNETARGALTSYLLQTTEGRRALSVPSGWDDSRHRLHIFDLFESN